MSSDSSPALSLELPQTAVRWLPAGLLLISSVGLPWLMVSLWQASVIAVLGVCLAGWWLWQQGWANPARRIKALHWQQSGRWLLQPSDGEAIEASLLARSWRSPWMMCLKFVSLSASRYQSRYQVMLWRGEFSAASWHQWQLRLKLQGHATLPQVPALS